MGDDFEGYVEEVALKFLQAKGWDGFWAENSLWWMVMALLYWEVLYARLPGVWHPEFGEFPSTLQDMPQVFFSPNFYERRRQLIVDRSEELRTANLSEEIATAYAQHRRKPCRPVENWEQFSLTQLQPVCAVFPNDAVLSCIDRLLRDFRINRSGLPDLILWRDGKPAVAEVKGLGDRLSGEQQRWLEFFRNAGIHACVVRVQNSDSPR